MIEDISSAKIRWKCHRGMLELDLILLSFFDEKFSKLSNELQQEFQEMLKLTDPELLSILVQGDESYQKTLNISKYIRSGMSYN